MTVDGRVAAAVSMDGTSEGTVFVEFDGDASLSVVRASAAEAVVTGTISCAARAGPAGPIAASLVVVAVVATAAAVLQRPAAPRTG